MTIARRALLLFVLMFSSLSCPADQLIIEPDMGREPLLQAIASTNHTLDLVMYGFTDETLLNAILKQKQRGRTVKVILEEQPYKNVNENDRTYAALQANQVALQGHIAPFRLIHQKTLVIDDKQAIVMTFNFTHSSFKNERNFALVIDDPAKVHEIANVFQADWNHVPSSQHSADLIYSPDNSRAKFIELINSANQSIKIYQQTVSDYKIVGALAKAARNGVNVEILAAYAPRPNQADYLQRAGVALRVSKPLYIHAKAMIIDNKEAVIGSINFTRSSFDDNRELAVVTHDQSVVQTLMRTFDSDWNNSQGGNEHVRKNTKKKQLAYQRKMLRTVRWIQKQLM